LRNNFPRDRTNNIYKKYFQDNYEVLNILYRTYYTIEKMITAIFLTTFPSKKANTQNVDSSSFYHHQIHFVYYLSNIFLAKNSSKIALQ